MMQVKESNRTLRLVVGSGLYQAVWFAAVFSAVDASRWWWSVLGVLGYLGLVWVVWPALHRRVLILLGAAVICGLVLDTAMIATHVWTSPHMFLPSPLPPLWLIMLWAAFGIYIAVGLEVLYGRYRVAAFVGAIGGMLAYRGGAVLGAIFWGEPVWFSTLVLMGAWAVAFPLLIGIATRLQRKQLPATEHDVRMRIAFM